MTTETTAAPGAAASTAAPAPNANDIQGLANPNENGAGGAQTTEGDPEADRAKESRNVQRRIDNLLRTRTEARTEAQIERQRREALEAEIQQLRGRQQPQEGQGQGQGEQRQAPRPEDIEQRVEQRAAEVATVREAAAKANKVFEAGVKAFGDEAFKASVSILQDEAGPLYQRSGMPTALGEAITDSDNPAALLHHLGQNPEVAESLKGLSAAQLGRRIARIEASMAASSEQKPSGAPKPLAPVKGGGGGTGDPSPTSPDYMAWKLKQLRGR